MMDMNKFDVLKMKMVTDFKNKSKWNFSLKEVNYPQIIKR